jgi:TPR repeat protein
MPKGIDISGLRKSADSGNPAAQSILGVCYLHGIDVDANYSEAFRLLSVAKTSRAVVNLAWMYAEGLGIPKDMAQAVRLYKAVANVEFRAQLELGRLYSHGDEAPIDLREALKWYSAAAARDENNYVGDAATAAFAGSATQEEIREAKDFVARHGQTLKS